MINVLKFYRNTNFFTYLSIDGHSKDPYKKIFGILIPKDSNIKLIPITPMKNIHEIFRLGFASNTFVNLSKVNIIINMDIVMMENIIFIPSTNTDQCYYGIYREYYIYCYNLYYSLFN